MAQEDFPPFANYFVLWARLDVLGILSVWLLLLLLGEYSDALPADVLAGPDFKQVLMA